MRGRLTPWLLILWLAGCRGGEDAAVPFPAEPSRIVCASPAVAEIVFALGAGDRVAAVADFTDWPPEAAEKPRIGGALSPSRERILALQADLILSQGRSEALAALAREHRIAFFSLPLDTLSDVRAAIAGCAARLNAEERGRRLLREFDAGLAALPRREPVPVLIALGHSPGDLSGLMTTGAGTFLHDIVELAGGRNVFKDVPLPWPRISRESLLRRAPALVLDLQAVALDDTRRAALAADWQRLGFAPAQVRILEEDFLLRPGPRAPLAAARIAESIHHISATPSP
ncbi:MAG: ABC transporter substrate-binding protein [Kiritimatiellae bacterium]|mgnify:FL=1|nr:ABC transporter substrate-binding protein [Kiritimatiellia bacterium]MDD3440973.1 ABC transporter substrate-binding protein [Kiritimatiellia bacterium]